MLSENILDAGEEVGSEEMLDENGNIGLADLIYNRPEGLD